jgi:hypothetical protein
MLRRTSSSALLNGFVFFTIEIDRFEISFFSWGGVRLSPLVTSATLVYYTSSGWWAWSSWWNENWQGNRSTRRKPALVPICPPQIPPDLGSNPGRRGGKPANNRLSYGAAWNEIAQTSAFNPACCDILRSDAVIALFRTMRVCSSFRMSVGAYNAATFCGQVLS